MSTMTSSTAPPRAVDVLRLAGRHVGVVDAANGAAARDRLVALRDLEAVPDRAVDDVGSKPLEEHAAVVAELPRG